jgi:hypothetical protein
MYNYVRYVTQWQSSKPTLALLLAVHHGSAAIQIIFIKYYLLLLSNKIREVPNSYESVSYDDNYSTPRRIHSSEISCNNLHNESHFYN